MNYVVWDIETDSAQLDWATMIEIGAILLDENFNEKDRFTARCRMPQDRVPSATALCINKSNVAWGGAVFYNACFVKSKGVVKVSSSGTFV